MRRALLVLLFCLAAVPAFGQNWVVTNGGTSTTVQTTVPAVKIRQNGSGYILALYAGTTPVCTVDTSGNLSCIGTIGGGSLSNPMTTSGDVIYGGAVGAPARLGIGSTGQCLIVAAALPSWGTCLNLVNGSLGIGTASPAEIIHVSGATSFIRINGTTDSGEGIKFTGSGTSTGRAWKFLAGGGTNGAVGDTGFGLLDDTAGATRWMVSSAGQIGIGTTTPSELLHLEGAMPYLRVRGTTGDGEGIKFAPTGANTGRSWKFLAGGGTNGIVDNDGFGLVDDTSNSLRWMVNTTGKMGVGIIPTEQLHVYGSDVILKVEDANNAGSQLQLKSARDWRLLAGGGSNGIISNADDFAVLDKTANLSRFQIDSAGTVKIIKQLQFMGVSSGSVTLKAAAGGLTATYTLPTGDGTADQVLKTDGAGTLSWATVSSGGGGGGGMTNPLTTTGDVIYSSFATTPARLGIGSSGQCLQVSGGLPAWGTCTSLIMPYIDVRSYGAVCDGASSASTNRTAINNAIAAAAGGVVIFPSGTCLVDGNLSVTNSSVWLMGAGMGVTIIDWGSNNGGIVGSFNSKAQQIHITDMSLRTATDLTQTAVRLTWPAQPGDTLFGRQGEIRNVMIEPQSGAGDTNSAWLKGIYITDACCGGVKITSTQINFRSNCTNGACTGAYGVQTDGLTIAILDRVNVSFAEYGAHFGGNTESTDIFGSAFAPVNYGIFIDATCFCGSGVSNFFRISGSHVSANIAGITLKQTGQSSITDVLIFRGTDTANWFGIVGDAASYENRIENNTIDTIVADAGGYVTAGIYLAGDRNVVVGNLLTGASADLDFDVVTPAGADYNTVSHNRKGRGTAAFVASDSGSNNKYESNWP